ncbi:MAG: PEGA domain-containing protein [Candidatus Krumholzibacteriota bacterium]|nr:PEGA domain-containing protein [Candidatus Krumholzibacteriota bacterium]
MFFGREDDFRFIRQKVKSEMGGLIVLCGTRRSGKTSILFQIMHGRLGDDCLPVLIDMQAITVETDFDFLTEVGQGIVETVGDPEISLEKDFLAFRDENPLAAFQNLIKKTIRKLGGRKLVILFDEYELFESHIAKGTISREVLNIFSNWLDHEQGVFMIFTGSDKLEERRADYWAGFLSKALHRRIGFLSRSDTLRMILEPLAGEIEYAEGIPERIYELTAGQPFYTQVLCQAIVDRLNELRKRNVTRADLDHVVDQIVENPLPHMVFSWNSLPNLEKLSLSVIGEMNKSEIRPVRARDILAFAAEERIGYDIRANRLNETLEKLFHQDILSKKGTEDSYTFKMDLWRRWIPRMHSLWKVIDEIKDAEKLGTGITRHRGWRYRVSVGLGLAGAVAFVIAVWRPPDPKPIPVGGGATDSTWLSVRTDPPRANVILDDKIIGPSPVIRRRVAAGAAHLLIRSAGFRDYRTELTLKKEKPFDTTITLTESTGHLELTSTPVGAQIHINGEYAGQTPRTINDLSVNRSYEIKMTLHTYDDFVMQNVRVHEDSLFVVRADFQRSKSDVLFVSVPRGAQVYLDDRDIGVTPSTHSIYFGPHRVVLRLDGYGEEYRDITVPVEGNTLELVMTRLPPGLLVVRVSPYADIFIDGELKRSGAVNYTAELAIGKYEIRLEHPELGARSEVVSITSRDTTTVQFDLMSRGGNQ